jgi:hypothetical protein
VLHPGGRRRARLGGAGDAHARHVRNGPGPTAPVSTSGPLDPTKHYLAEVQGTYSLWSKASWARPCDLTFKAAPIFASPGTANGPVGVDPEFIFAAPEGSVRCNKTKPLHFEEFEINTGGGFAHREPLGAPSAPTADHRYTYLLPGGGTVASFSFRSTTTSCPTTTASCGSSSGPSRRTTASRTAGAGSDLFRNQGACVSSSVN